MAISGIVMVPRATNFALRRTTKCMNCGSEIVSGTDMYSKRFCSSHCREEYLI